MWWCLLGDKTMTPTFQHRYLEDQAFRREVDAYVAGWIRKQSNFRHEYGKYDLRAIRSEPWELLFDPLDSPADREMIKNALLNVEEGCWLDIELSKESCHIKLVGHRQEQRKGRDDVFVEQVPYFLVYTGAQGPPPQNEAFALMEAAWRMGKDDATSL